MFVKKSGNISVFLWTFHTERILFSLHRRNTGELGSCVQIKLDRKIEVMFHLMQTVLQK